MAAIIKTPVLIRLKCMYSWEGRGCHRVLGTLRTPNRQWRYRFGKVPLGVKLQTELMTRQRCRRLQSRNNFIMSERELSTVFSRKSCPAVYRYIPSTVRPQICQNMIISKDIWMTERGSPLPNPLGLTRAVCAPLPRPYLSMSDNEHCIAFNLFLHFFLVCLLLLLQMKCIHPVAILFFFFFTWICLGISCCCCCARSLTYPLSMIKNAK